MASSQYTADKPLVEEPEPNLYHEGAMMFKHIKPDLPASGRCFKTTLMGFNIFFFVSSWDFRIYNTSMTAGIFHTTVSFKS